MNITKKLLTVVAAATMSITGLVATGGAASAANTNIYKINLDHGSSASNAKEFTQCQGKLFFTADTVDHGRALFYTSATTPGAATFAASNATATAYGNPMGLSCVGDYITYGDNVKGVGGFNFYAYKISTGVNAELKAPGDISFATNDWKAPKVAMLGNLGYFLTGLDGDSDLKLWSIDGTTGAITQILAGQSADIASFTAFGGKIWASGVNGAVASFDPSTTTWTPATYSGQGNFGAPTIVGQYRYNGADVLVLSASIANWTKASYYMDASGNITRFGTWDNGYGTNFVNYGERLFAWQYNTIKEVDTTSGELVDNIWQGIFPTAQAFQIEGVLQAATGHLMFMAQVLDPNTNPNNQEFLYDWNGTNPATRMGTLGAAPGTTWIPEYPNVQNGWGRNTAMAPLANGMVLNLFLTSEIGYEPYYVVADGTAVSLGNLNTGTEGSYPDARCMGSANGTDYMSGTIIGTDNTAHSVVTAFKQNGVYLDYSISDLGNIQNPCAFASDGTTTYFQAYDRQSSQQTLYKVNTDGTFTALGALPEYGYAAVVAGGKYFFVDDDNYGLWSYDLSTNTATNIVHNGNDQWGSVNEELVNVGSKVYFATSDSNNNYYYDLYSVDANNVSAAPVKITNNTSNDWTAQPVSLTVSGTNVLFLENPDNTDGTKLFSLDTTTGVASVVTDLWANNNNSDRPDKLFLAGDNVYAQVWDDSTQARVLIKVVMSTKVATVQTMPNGFALQCSVPAGQKLLVEGTSGELKYFSDGTLTDAGVSLPAGDDSLCYNYYAHATPLGEYVSMREYNTPGGPFSNEPAYIGTLIPRGVLRLGQTVNEVATASGTSVDTGWVLPGGSTPAVDTDNPDLGTLDETVTFTGTKGSINFPDGSGFDIDAKGRIFPKVKSKFLPTTSGKLTVTYTVAGKTKVYSCNVAAFGSVKKLKKVPTKAVLYKSKKFCQMPPAAIKALKTGVINIKMIATIKRLYATTAKAKMPTGKAIKPLKRTMRVRMSAIRQ